MRTSILSRSFLLAAFLLGCWPVSAAPRRRSSNPPAEVASSQTTQAIRSIDSGTLLFVNGKNGAGSAFLAELFGENLIVSNAHVYLEIEEPIITDINNFNYRITRIRAARERDLVILSVAELPPQSSPLKIHANVSSIYPDSSVVACGNSLGDNVLNYSAGKLNGVGPDRIEINAGIVPGNSGGPVLLASDGRVIGVSTYLRFIQPRPDTIGSRFEGSWLFPVIRRFATRIDNLELSDFEEVELSAVQDDRKCLASVEKFIEELGKGRSLEAIRNVYRKYSGSYRNACHHSWHSRYMQKNFEEKQQRFQPLFDQMAREIGNPVEDLLLEFANEVSSRPRSARSCRCPVCSGSGTVEEMRANPNYSRHKAEPERKMFRESCSVCHGRGSLELTPKGVDFQLSGTLRKKMLGLIEPETEPFFGFLLGCGSDELAKLRYYNRKSNLIGRASNGFGITFFFRGNHQIRNAQLTVLQFQLGRLTRVEIIGPMRGDVELREFNSCRDRYANAILSGNILRGNQSNSGTYRLRNERGFHDALPETFNSDENPVVRFVAELPFSKQCTQITLNQD